MGVNLSGITPVKQIEISDLRGRTIAIDAFNTIYQFITIIRDRFTGELLRDSKGRVTSHLSGLLYRTTRLIENGVDPVFVFDGEPPAFKKATRESRMEIKKRAGEKLDDARERGDVEAIRRYAQATAKLTGEMIEHSKLLLGYMGIPVIQAPSEGEAQAAHMVNTGKVWAAGSQDWDSLLFGAGRMVKNLTITGKRKIPRKEDYVEVKPELIELGPMLSGLGLTRDQLIIIGIIIGTDYNPGGVKGIGPKNALKLVKEHKTMDNVLKNVEWECSTSADEIFEFFKKPPTNETEIEKVKPDYGKLMEFMLGFDFSEGRIEKTIERLKKTKKTGSLQRWLG